MIVHPPMDTLPTYTKFLTVPTDLVLEDKMDRLIAKWMKNKKVVDRLM